MTIDEALSYFLLQLEADGRSIHTRSQYRIHIGLLARSMPGVSVRDVTHIHLAQFLVSRAVTHRADGQPKKTTSVNAVRTSLRTFFGYLSSADVIPSNPARLIRRAKCGAPPPRSLSSADGERLLATLARASGWQAERDYALFHLLLSTGVRIGSALALDAEDVDLERGELLLRCTKGDRPGVVYLNEGIRKHLATYIKDAGPLFLSRQNRRMCSRQAQVRLAQWLERAGVARRVSPHGLRHSFATALYARTGDVFLVKESLTHRSITSTLIYATRDVESLRRALGHATTPSHRDDYLRATSSA